MAVFIFILMHSAESTATPVRGTMSAVLADAAITDVPEVLTETKRPLPLTSRLLSRLLRPLMVNETADECNGLNAVPVTAVVLYVTGPCTQKAFDQYLYLMNSR